MNPFTLLAKNAVELYVKEQKILEVPEDISQELLERKAGVFVTLYKGKQLRGCIGTYLPTQENIAQEIISNAISSCTRDYRFHSVKPNELPELRYEVSILSTPQAVQNTEHLDCKKYGIIIQSGYKIGLLLPDIEGVNSVEEQISIACQKAGIKPNIDNIKLFSFTVEKYSN